MRNRVLALALVLLASTNLLAQVVIDVEVVDVPVFVARGDTPLAGLTRDQFELYVNGRPQPIEYFEAVAAGEDAPTLRERRLFLLLFDVAFSHPLSLPRAQRAAAEWIAKAPPADYFAIATYSGRRGVWFAAPFTRDRESLGRAIRSLSNPRSGDPLAIVMTDAERATPQDWAEAGELASETLRDVNRMEMIRAAENQIEGLAEVSERLAPLEGQKHVVVLSEGWDGRSASTFRLASMSRPPAATWTGVGFHTGLFNDLAAMHRRFHASGVFLHTLDLEGVSASLADNDGLHALALGTGGKFVQGRSDLGRALGDLSTSLDRGYRLGFRPVNAKRGYNTIEVRVRDGGRGLRVDHRRGFSSASEPANVHDGLYLADVVLNDVPQSGTAAILTLSDGTLSAQIPMRELAAQGQSAELLVYAFAADGAALMYHREVITVLDVEAKTFAIAVPEGTKVAKALLRVNGSVGFSLVKDEG
ncbi:MAG: VWA domain-containing protein [Thermoanaerobaculia bacterium]